MVPNEASVSVCRRDSADAGSDPLSVVVWVRGDHDLATRAHLAATIAQAARLDDADVIVDLSATTFMDASTVNTLVEAHNSLRACARSLRVRAPSPIARRLLDVCKLGFLIDGRVTPRASVAALDSWVAVPASGAVPGATHRPVDPSAVPEGTAHPSAPQRGELAESVPHQRTQS